MLANGGEVKSSEKREYGKANLTKIFKEDQFISGMADHSQVWMSHGDTIVDLPSSFKSISSTESIPVAAFKVEGKTHYGIQFHPEVYHSTDGIKVLEN